MPKYTLCTFLRFFTPCFISLLFIAACATIQSPTGGPPDKTPPEILKETPANFSLNFSAQKIAIEFDEFFKLNNEFKEISLSPSMERTPEYKVKRKVLEIKFTDTLEKNTTYTINFGKAIADYNEGNILKNYSYVFSTGPVIDSLQISGNITNSITMKPVFEAMVVLVPANQDTLFRKKTASVFSLTDSAGNFSLHHLKPGKYRLFSLKEQNGDRIYTAPGTEEIGFIKDTIHLTKDTSGLNMKLFKEIPQVFRVTEHRIQPNGHLSFIFNRPLLNPKLRLIDTILDRNKASEFVPTRDSASIWLPEITFDSLHVEINENGKPLDTVTLRRSKNTTYNTTLSTTTNINNSKIREGTDLILTFNAPVKSIDGDKITLLEDSLDVGGVQLTRDSSDRKIRMKYNWKNKKTYILKVDEGAITAINNGKNKAFNDAFLVDPEENYATLILTIKPPDTSNAYVVQLLRNDSEIFQQSSVNNTRVLTYPHLAPGTYKARIVYDTNKNGKWDTGSLSENMQPETIWNYSKLFTLRANQDLKEEVVIPPLQP